MKAGKYILLSLLFFSSLSIAKKLIIHKCQLVNGVISYQEDSCSIISQSSVLNNKNRNLIKLEESTEDKVPIVYSVNSKQLKSIDTNSQSIRIITNDVKGYQFSIETLNRWGIANKVYNNKLLHIEIKDNKLGNELAARIDFQFGKNKMFTTQELTEMVSLVGSRFVDGSLEGRVDVYSINAIEGKGAIASFTHSTIVPDYRYSSKGVIFKNDWLIQFTLFSNNLTSYSHEFVLQSLFKTLSIKKK